MEKFSETNPIPPLSYIKLIRSDDETPQWANNVGKVSRIGYYSRQDGLDVIWLVDEEGVYKETIDHQGLYKYFLILSVSDETDYYGVEREVIGTIEEEAKNG